MHKTVGYDKATQRVDIRLQHSRNTETTFWSPQYNSYVLREVKEEDINPGYLNPGAIWKLPDGRRVFLLSINGIGEVRWSVPHSGSADGDLDAARYFNLTPVTE